MADAVEAGRFWAFIGQEWVDLAVQQRNAIAEGEDPRLGVQVPGMPPTARLADEVRNLLAQVLGGESPGASAAPTREGYHGSDAASSAWSGVGRRGESFECGAEVGDGVGQGKDVSQVCQHLVGLDGAAAHAIQSSDDRGAAASFDAVD